MPPSVKNGIISYLSPDFEFDSIFHGVLDKELQPFQVHLLHLLGEGLGRGVDSVGREAEIPDVPGLLEEDLFEFRLIQLVHVDDGEGDGPGNLLVAQVIKDFLQDGRVDAGFWGPWAQRINCADRGGLKPELSSIQVKFTADHGAKSVACGPWSVVF